MAAEFIPQLPPRRGATTGKRQTVRDGPDLVAARKMLNNLCGLGESVTEERLKRALTHRSVLGVHGDVRTNERFEFLGDAILQFLVSKYLFFDQSNENEGSLSTVRDTIVKGKSLAAAATRAGINAEMVWVGRSVIGSLTSLELDKNILANVSEALIAAVYLDAGEEAAWAFVSAYLYEEIVAGVEILSRKAEDGGTIATASTTTAGPAPSTEGSTVDGTSVFELSSDDDVLTGSVVDTGVSDWETHVTGTTGTAGGYLSGTDYGGRGRGGVDGGSGRGGSAELKSSPVQRSGVARRHYGEVGLDDHGLPVVAATYTGNYKGQLNDLALRYWKTAVVYDTHRAAGPAHAPVFIATASIEVGDVGARVEGTGRDSTKKGAEQEAALAMLELLATRFRTYAQLEASYLKPRELAEEIRADTGRLERWMHGGADEGIEAAVVEWLHKEVSMAGGDPAAAVSPIHRVSFGSAAGSVGKTGSHDTYGSAASTVSEEYDLNRSRPRLRRPSPGSRRVSGGGSASGSMRSGSSNTSRRVPYQDQYHPKTILQEYCIQEFGEYPTYTEGSEGNKFTCVCYVRGRERGRGEGLRKKDAATAAAEDACIGFGLL